jgi:hypothetical protein
MLLAALLVLLGASPAAPAPSTRATQQADCLRGCAGEASGQRLVACLQRCEAPAPDAGVP